MQYCCIGAHCDASYCTLLTLRASVILKSTNMGIHNTNHTKKGRERELMDSNLVESRERELHNGMVYMLEASTQDH
jgi:hypothetical protein